MASLTRLNYRFSPDQVFAADTLDIKLTVENPTDGCDVKFDGGADPSVVEITFPVGGNPDDLVNQLNFQATVVPEAYTCMQSDVTKNFNLRATRTRTMSPGDKIEITFLKVGINGAAGTAEINIKEDIGNVLDKCKDDGSTKISISKSTKALDIIAWLDPWGVGLAGQSTLRWRATGGTRVEVSGFPTPPNTRPGKIEGDPPYSGDFQVTVPATESQRIYTASVYTSDNQHTDKQVALTQYAPFIQYFNDDISDDDKNKPIRVSDTVKLSWSSVYGASSSLKPPGTAIPYPVNFPQERDVIPGMDLVKVYAGSYAAMPDTASYKLTVSGYQHNPSETLSFKLAPVDLGYFKYADKGLTQVTWATDPADWPAIKVDLGSPAVLTIYQPGGKTNVYYLGTADTTHPQIQYFDATKNANGKYTFSWVTANLESLVLNPGGQKIPAAQIKEGSIELSLTDEQYVLTGIGNNEEFVVSKLGVPYSPTESNQAGKIFSAEVREDPNCKIVVSGTENIPNYFDPAPAHKKDAAEVIAKLTFADIWRLPPFRLTHGTVRLDVQGSIAGGGRNWQVQVNGITGKSTIAAVLVQGNVATASTPERKAYVERMVRSALVASLNEKKLKNVNGPCL